MNDEQRKVTQNEYYRFLILALLQKYKRMERNEIIDVASDYLNPVHPNTMKTIPSDQKMTTAIKEMEWVIQELHRSELIERPEHGNYKWSDEGLYELGYLSEKITDDLENIENAVNGICPISQKALTLATEYYEKNKEDIKVQQAEVLRKRMEEL